MENADLIYTSNLFGNDVALYFAHDLAVKQGKKTLFVVAEDFKDMLGWEWVWTEESAMRRWRRVRTLRSLDLAVRKRVRNSSLTFLHTPAVVSRYRLEAMNAFAIRQPVHELADVVSDDALSARQTDLLRGVTLQIATASRMQALDLLIRAISLMRGRGVVTRLTVYGGGPQNRELEKLVQVHGIEDWVNFAGAFPPAPALREALGRSHVFVMPHLTTDFGRVFLTGWQRLCQSWLSALRRARAPYGMAWMGAGAECGCGSAGYRVGSTGCGPKRVVRDGCRSAAASAAEYAVGVEPFAFWLGERFVREACRCLREGRQQGRSTGGVECLARFRAGASMANRGGFVLCAIRRR